VSFHSFNPRLKISNSFLGVRMSFRQSSLQFFTAAFQLIALRQEAFVAHHQHIVIFDAMIHNVL
jgi:hypothetical protein